MSPLSVLLHEQNIYKRDFYVFIYVDLYTISYLNNISNKNNTSLD